MNDIEKIIRQNEILLDLCIGLRAETEALRNVLLHDIVENGGDGIRIKAFYEESLASAKNTIFAQIKAHYLMDGGPDDILRSAFPAP